MPLRSKDELEKYLSKRTNELFDLNDKIILYDLTNTYFEGAVGNSKIAKLGRSKEKRTDARLVVLAVVVNTEGFLKYSQIFEGNIADCSTLEKIIDEWSPRTSSSERNPTVVLDAGIATADNLKLLKGKKFGYMCVSRSGMKQYAVDTSSQPIKICDKKGQPLVLQKVTVADSTGNWLRVHSEAKALKELGMNSRFSQRFEEGLSQIKESLGKKNGVKKQEKVWEHIGRLKAKYASMHKYYQIDSEVNNEGVVSSIAWKQKPVEKNEGYYLLCTTLDQKDEKTQWTIYNTIREIEATLRTLKTDLDLGAPSTIKQIRLRWHIFTWNYWLIVQ